MADLISLWTIFRVLVFPGFTFIFIFAMFCEWIERKIKARMQNRRGPMTTGYAGLLQPWADFVKLLTKESVTPKNSRSFLFRIAPLMAFSVTFFALFFLPIDGQNIVPDSAFNGDLILVLALLSVANFFLFLAGWSSNNPYSKIGGARVMLLTLGYDIPFFILALAPALLGNSLSIAGIVTAQATLFPYLPFALYAPWVLVLFIVALQAQLEKDPFDIPHAESEVVGGPETEYSGASLAILKLSKNVQCVLGASIITDLFLGGPNGPVLFGLTALFGTIWFLLKVIIIVIVIEYIACIFARVRIDQVLSLNWRILMPLAIIAIVPVIFIAMWLNGVAVP